MKISHKLIKSNFTPYTQKPLILDLKTQQASLYRLNVTLNKELYYYDFFLFGDENKCPDCISKYSQLNRIFKISGICVESSSKVRHSTTVNCENKDWSYAEMQKYIWLYTRFHKKINYL
ncbi:hypothetical protein RF11_03466 [Thelohanellus kitauei]|uniref:Uncharacterized protein n=1 Tax=Thelohanellus kitauei TaxID=669202 RepID=A0A0C2MM43_THEKT|nr:hypothetical protein RF11_03466 [Thelohanellus kitauei]